MSPAHMGEACVQLWGLQLEYLEKSLDPHQQSRIHDLHARALRWDPVERLVIVMQYPIPDGRNPDVSQPPSP